jgi:cytochrome P450
LIAGLETTQHMLALGTLALLRHPDQLAALRADPGLVDTTVEELLRYLSIVQYGVTRTARENAEVNGHPVGKGETVIASLAAANRDAARFHDPDRLDIRRQRVPHVAFGHGIHQCIGAPLARTEMKIGFRALLARIPALRLAVPIEEIALGEDMVFYGVHELPVSWD